MDPETARRVLLEKERELVSDIGRYDQNARESRGDEVRDPIDEATTEVLEATSYAESGVERHTLTLVRNALRAIDEGTYGVCIDCGNPIEPARLKAVPWTPYCRADQEKHDRERTP